MSEPRDEQETARALVDLAHERLPFDRAGITLRERNGSLRTLAGSDPVVHDLDSLQDPGAGGPILETMIGGTDLVVMDLANEARWPQWCASAAEHGVHGVVTSRLLYHQSPQAVLSLYVTTTQPVTSEAVVTARRFAREASMAMRVSNELWHLHRAIENRTVIGQAEGLLMEKYGLDEVRAVALLKRISSQSNRKLHVVASEIVATRQVIT